jgi:hypothetical protein
VRFETVRIHRLQVCSTSPARGIGKNNVPALTVGCGCRRSSKAVTTSAEGPEHIRFVILVDDS